MRLSDETGLDLRMKDGCIRVYSRMTPSWIDITELLSLVSELSAKELTPKIPSYETMVWVNGVILLSAKDEPGLFSMSMSNTKTTHHDTQLFTGEIL